MSQRIAIVGSGISGLAAAWLLNRKHEVHLFERRDRLGGHTFTVDHAAPQGRVALDTGFLVYNERTYPTLTRVFDRLSIATQASDMSFAVSCRNPDLEYAGTGLSSLFAQTRNLLRPWYLRMLVEMWRFGKVGSRILEERPDPSVSLGQFLADEGFSSAFGTYFLLPMAGAIWSTGTGLTPEFPRDTLLRFFANHGLLTISDHPQWRTVVGGSSSYIAPMIRGFADRVHLGTGVERILRDRRGATLQFTDGGTEIFDHVVVAAHADQALAMLADPTPEESEVFGAWRYSGNDTWLHTDTSLMPRRRAAWSSWNSLIEDAGERSTAVSLSYHLNRLQRIESETQYMVTLNPFRAPRPESVIRRMTYHHPIYEPASVAAQERLPSLNGVNRTHFCGAYFGYGFHEDGLVSAVRVAEDFGISI